MINDANRTLDWPGLLCLVSCHLVLFDALHLLPVLSTLAINHLVPAINPGRAVCVPLLALNSQHARLDLCRPPTSP
jgi:hypothetical protein